MTQLPSSRTVTCLAALTFSTFVGVSLTHATTLAQWTLDESSGLVTSVTSSGSNATTLTAPSGQEPTGNTFTDSTGPNQGTYPAADFAAVDSGDWLESSSSLSYLNFGAGQAFTIEAWVYAESNSATGRNIFSNRETGGQGGGDNEGISLYFRANGQVGINIDLGGTAANITGGSMSLNEWHHIAGVRESDGTIRAYLDGTQVNASGASYSAAFSSENLAFIGRAGNTAQQEQTWDGGINVVRISDVALTPGEFLAAPIPEPEQNAAGLALIALLITWYMRRRAR